MIEEIETWTAEDENNLILNQIDRAILSLLQDRVILEILAAELLQLAPVDATPHWRKKNGKRRYLYLLHPTTEGVRRRQYIGNKPDRTQAALRRVQAHADLTETDRQISDINARLAATRSLLQRALWLATSSNP